MKKQPKVDEALSLLKRATGQVSAVRRALEQSVERAMDAPGGMEWENQVSEPEPEDEPEGPAPTPPPWELERRKAQAEEFERNWFGRIRERLRGRRRKGP